MVIFVIAYLILAIIVGLYGSSRNFGFWGFFFISLIITPLLVMIFLLLTKDKSLKREK
jgi:hypothetical protein